MSLPKKWEETTLGECQSKTKTIDPRHFPNESFDLFSVPSYSNGSPDQNRGSEIGSAKQIVQEGDVLLCKIVPHIRRAWVVPPPEKRRQIASGEWIVLSCYGLEPGFLRSFLLSDIFHEQFMRTVSGVGGSLMRARPAEAAKISIPLPPISEQRRVVAKLEALVARLARARAELARVPSLVENLRRQVVRQAFDGSLTTDFREGNPTFKALDDEALEKEYETETGARRRKPVAEIDWRPTLDLPDSWRWVSIDRILAEVQYGSSAKTNSDVSGVPVLRMGNIQQGKIDWTELKYLPQDHDEFPNLLLHEGDVLFNRTNSFELVGKTAAIGKIERPVSFASYLIRVRPIGVLPELLAYYLNSAYARQWIDRVASQQVGQANVNGTKLKGLGIPLQSCEEQAEMLKRINSAMAHADRLEAEYARAVELIDKLESAILAKAFKGELVPQDQNDEPASVMLERVGTQRTEAPKRKRA